MKFLVLLLASLLPVLAECQVSDNVFVLGLDQCDELLAQGDGFTQEAVNRATEELWQDAWRYVDEGLMIYLSATNVCTDDRHEIANRQLDQNRRVSKAMTCTFHILNVKDASTRSKLAYEHIKDFEQSLRHAQFALYSIEEGLRWCTGVEDQEGLVKARSSTILAIAQIEEMIAWKEQNK